MKSKQTLFLTGLLTICFASIGFYLSITTAANLNEFSNLLHQSPSSLSFQLRGNTYQQEQRLSLASSAQLQLHLQPPQRYAIVHLIDTYNTIYEAAMLASLHRLVEIHSNLRRSSSQEDLSSSLRLLQQLDLVVLYHPGRVNLTGYEHPYIRYVPFDGTEIEQALDSKEYPEWEVATHYKLCAMQLVEYSKVVFLDLDFVQRHQLATILVEAQTPALVQWGEYPQLDYNTGFHILKPNLEMFQDAVEALRKIGNYYAATEELQDLSTLTSLQEKGIPKDPSQWGGYRSDQEFTFAFYEILPKTSRKWGPIHPLPYRYNAREESVSYNTGRFLTRTTTTTKPILTPPGVYNGAHLHLFGDFGQDGKGHRLNPISTQDGRFGLMGVHFTTRKPWKEGRLYNKKEKKIVFHDHLTNNTALNPQERCPDYIYHVMFWQGVIDGMTTALQDRRYGFRWGLATNELWQFLQKHLVVQKCLDPEYQALVQVKQTVLQQTKDGGDCPDPTDCSNKHCQWRYPSTPCAVVDELPFTPLIQNLS